MNDFEITLGNCIDLDIDVMEDDEREPVQEELFEDEDA